MKKFMTFVLVHSSYYLILSLITFIVLFDTDGGFALGTSIWTATPLPVITIAGILGNLLWILGLILWAAGIVMFTMALSDDTINKTTDEAHTAGKLAKQGNVSLYGGVCLYSTLALGIFTIGSGFWFSGIGITLLILGIMVWRQVLIVARDAKLKKLKSEEKTVSVEDLLEN